MCQQNSYEQHQQLENALLPTKSLSPSFPKMQTVLNGDSLNVKLADGLNDSDASSHRTSEVSLKAQKDDALERYLVELAIISDRYLL